MGRAPLDRPMADGGQWTVVVVDDEPAGREAIRALLAEDARLRIVGRNNFV